MLVYIVVSIIIIVYLLYNVIVLEGRIKYLQNNLNQVSGHPEKSNHPVNDDLRLLIKEGKDIKAIKKAREVFGFSLLEGKEYIEKLKKDK